MGYSELRFNKDNIFYLPLNYVEFLHKDIIQIYKKSEDPIAKGYMSKSNLEFILEYVKDIYNNSKSKETKLINKAAFIFYHIAVKHPFTDGNKRTSIIACSAFLEHNGYSIRHISFRDSRKFITEVAKGNKSEQKCQKFIKKYISKYIIPKEIEKAVAEYIKLKNN